jgi:capsular exopolysaccharide synthesis family protein
VQGYQFTRIWTATHLEESIMQKEETLELRWLFAVIRRWVWLIVGCTLLALIIAFAITSRIRPTYEATTTLLVMLSQDAQTNAYNSLQAGERLALTYGQMLKDRLILQAVIGRLGLSESPDALAKRIKVQPVKDTQLFRLSVTDGSPTRAPVIADAIAEEFTARVKALQEARYKDVTETIQAKLNEAEVLVSDAQSKADAAAAQKIVDEAELTRLATFLDEYRSQYKSVEDDYQTLQTTVSQLTDRVLVLDAARVPEERVRAPYTATVTLLVNQPRSSGGDAYSTVMASERLAVTYAQLLQEPTVLSAAIAQAGITESPDALAKRVRVELVPDTQLIRLNVADIKASQATRLANVIAETFVGQIRETMANPYASRLTTMQDSLDKLSAAINETQTKIGALTDEKLRKDTEAARAESLLAEYRSNYRTLQQNFEQLRLSATRAADTVVISERAHAPEEPVSGRWLYILLAVAMAAVGALGAAFLIEHFDDTVKTPEDIGRELGIATIGTICRFPKGDEGLVGLTHPNLPPAEDFRVLAANLRFAAVDAPLRTLVVTSAVSGEGKSEVVANLAVAMAGIGVRVIAVDADLRRPRLHHLFGLPQGRGLTESLRLGRFEDNLRDTQVDGLQVLTSGVLPVDPVQLISSPRMEQLLVELTHRADVVIVDTPPILGVADAAIMAAVSDGVLLVLRANQTSRQAVQLTIEALRKAKSRLVGAVLNGIPATSNSYYRYSQQDRPTRFADQLRLKWTPWESLRRPSSVRREQPRAQE